MTTVTDPIQIFTDTDGTPLEGGKIYVGKPGLDPRTNPVQVYWDAGRTIPAAQPIRTLAGRPAYQGSPSDIFIAETEYSVRTETKAGALVLSVSSLTDAAPDAQNVPIPTILPGENWDGTPGSGFASEPTDPPRSTAKPVLRLITPPRQAFDDTLVIGFAAGANDGGKLFPELGLSHVTVHFEGETHNITEPSLRSFADANGTMVHYYGWWITLKKPENVAGEARLYAEAVPRDTFMQNRVIGPFRYFPVATRYDHEIEVAASASEIAGERYQTMVGALTYLWSQNAQHAQITLTEAGTYDIASSAGSHDAHEFASWCDIRADVPVTFSRPAPDTALGFRPMRGPLHFIGNNITFDFVRATNFRAETAWQVGTWMDGVRLTNSAGRDALRFKGLHSALNHLLSSGGWMTECTVTNLFGNGSEISLARGNTFDTSWGDVLRATSCSIGNTLSDHDSAAYRSYLDALNVTYSGAGSATLEMNRSNGAGNRIITAKVDDVVVGTFAPLITYAAFIADTHYTIENVRDWLNTLSGWSATALDTTRRAAYLQAAGTIGAWGPVAIGVAPTTLQTFIDVHGDVFQFIGGENLWMSDNTGHGINGQILFLANGAFRDVMYLNNAFHNDEPVGNLSQLQQPQSHVVVAHNSNATQGLALRTNPTNISKYNPDVYCLITNNAYPSIGWSDGPNGVVTIADNILDAAASVPERGTGTVVGGDATNKYVDAANGDFRPAGALLDNLKEPRVLVDSAGFVRPIDGAEVGALSTSTVVAPSSGAFENGQSPTGSGATLSGSDGSRKVGFIQSGTDANVETVQTALRREVWADQYKLAADTDDSSCITRAVTALLAEGGGGVVRLSRRTYVLDNPLAFSGLNNVRLIGAGSNSSGTIIRENFLAGDGITFSNCQGCEISEVNFWPAVRKTDGFAVTLNTGCFGCAVDIRCDFGWNGLNIFGATETRYKINTRNMLGVVGVNFGGTLTHKSFRAICEDQISDNPYTLSAEASNAVTFSSGMTLSAGDHFVVNGAIWQCTAGGTAASSSPSGYPAGTTPESVFTGTVASGTATLKWVCNSNLAHIVQDSYAYSLIINNAALINGVFGLRQIDTANTGTSYPVWLFANDLECDHNYFVGIDLVAGEGFFDGGNVWVSSCIRGSGVIINSTYRGNVSFGAGSRFFGNDEAGCLRLPGAIDVRFNGTEMTNNSVSGLEITAGSIDTQVNGGRYGDSPSVSGNNQAYGIFIGNNSDKTTIIGANVRGNVTGGISLGTGLTDLIIDACPGYTPSAITAITVGASPFTWTNDTGSNAVVYITGGTVSAITLDAKAVGAATDQSIYVPRGSSIEVTYSSAPAIERRVV